jgi:hypothetical protein
MKHTHLFKAITIALLSTSGLSYNELHAQVKLTSANYFQVGYNSYTPMTFGSYTSSGVNNGRWAVEYWDNAISSGVGGLNFWVPWPNSGAMNNALFLRDGNGHVGIGRLPSYILDVNGTIRVSSTLYSSDERLKQNINPIKSALDNISKLNGKSYQKKNVDYTANTEGEKDETKLNTIKAQADRLKDEQNLTTEYGYIAQELKEVFPDLVSADENGILSINYVGLIPVTIEAIKEQQAKIEALQLQLNSCCTSSPVNSYGKAQTTGLGSPAGKSELARLQQNVPNPFTQNTTIAFFVSDKVNKAMLNVYDLQGTEIKSYAVNGKGDQTITIQSHDLKPGMYLYTLIADGVEIDTKRMILTK